MVASKSVAATAAALLMGTTVSANILEQIEETLLDSINISPADEHLANLNVAAQSVLEKAENKFNSVLGKPPVDALNAWRTVIDEIPNGAQKLMSEISAVASKAAPKTKMFSKLPSGEGFESVVQDEKFPGMQLRVKKPEGLGIDDVKQYSGYIDIEEDDKHFFYWFFEARNKPEDAPVILWLNGGPGCSSMTGLFFELGPSSIDEELKPVHRDYAWNTDANVIFLDQPVNTGLSYSASADVKDTVTAGQDVYAFLELFFKKFPEYTGRDFHIAGESYAGHYIPVFGAEIARHPERSFNLTSLLIGNGLIDPLSQYDYYQPQACGGGFYPSVLSEEKCQDMLDAQPKCNALIESCYASGSKWVCVPASIYCNNVMMGPYQETGLNVYDIREKCADSSDGLCYPQLNYITDYLNQPHVREALGVREDVESFQSCNFDVNGNFLLNGDWMLPYYTNVADLLEQGIPVLDYAGLADFICNALGTNGFSENLEWSGHEKFLDSPMKMWYLKDGEKAGRKRNYKHFTSLQIFEAGHMAPFDQPKALHEMVNEWIKGNYALN